MSKTTDYSWEHHEPYLEKTLLYAREGYEVYLEVNDYIPFLHLDILKWAPSTYRQIIIDLDDFKRLLRSFALPEVFGALPEDSNLGKLYKKLGMEKVTDHNGYDIYMMRTK